jgi:hypothetical protein
VDSDYLFDNFLQQLVFVRDLAREILRQFSVELPDNFNRTFLAETALSLR